MKGHIAIIDSDPVFARSMSQRLLHLFPLAKINLYAPEDLESDPLLELTEETILYDETCTDQAALNKHTGSSRPARFIPLQAQGSDGRRSMTGAELSKILNGAAQGITLRHTGLQESSPLSSSNLHKPTAEDVLYSPKGHMRILLSFAGHSEREKYAGSCTKSLLSTGLRIIRLDLMSGISITNPFRKKSGAKEVNNSVSTGISELLLHLENVKMEPDELLDFVQLGQDGCYHFGLPVRADDILCCHTDVLVRLLHLLRRISDSPDENTAVIVVIESLPFCVLKQLCSLSHELHIIMPPQDQSDEKMCEWELNDLFSSLPPNLLKFYSESRKISV